MNKKILLGIPLIALMALFAVYFVSGAGTAVPNCHFEGAGTTNASLESENTSIMFQVATNINMSNVTIAMSPGPNGNTSIYYSPLGTSTNLTTPVFSIGEVPDGFYTFTATARFSNATEDTSSFNVSALSATCIAEWTIDSSEGGGKIKVIAVSGAKTGGTDITIILIIIVILAILLISNKKK